MHVWNKCFLSFNNQIRCRAISWCRITPFLAKFIINSMVDIMISISNKSSCLFPYPIPWSISESCSKYQACFINANVIWSGLFSLKKILQKCQNIGRWFSFWEFCPGNNNTTWCTYCFHTVKPSYTSPPTSHPPHPHYFKGPNYVLQHVVWALGIFKKLFVLMF